jgi:hypothetical protein
MCIFVVAVVAQRTLDILALPKPLVSGQRFTAESPSIEVSAQP